MSSPSWDNVRNHPDLEEMERRGRWYDARAGLAAVFQFIAGLALFAVIWVMALALVVGFVAFTAYVSAEIWDVVWSILEGVQS